MKSDLTWHRPTQKFGSSDNFFNILWNNALSDKFNFFTEEKRFSEKISKLSEKDYANEEKNINALSLYWLFLFIVWIVFFTIMFVYNDSVIAWCKSLIS